MKKLLYLSYFLLGAVAAGQTKISELPPLDGSEAAADDVLPVVDTSAGAAGSKKITLEELFSTPVPWQGVPIADSRIASAAAWNAKEGGIAAGTTGQYWRGDKSWQTLDKNAVGLGNVDNTADASKPVSTATQAALDGKADADGGNIADAAAFQRATRGLGFNKITDEGHELWRLNQFLNRQQHGVGIDARNRVSTDTVFATSSTFGKTCAFSTYSRSAGDKSASFMTVRLPFFSSRLAVVSVFSSSVPSTVRPLVSVQVREGSAVAAARVRSSRGGSGGVSRAGQLSQAVAAANLDRQWKVAPRSGANGPRAEFFQPASREHAPDDRRWETTKRAKGETADPRVAGGVRFK